MKYNRNDIVNPFKVKIIHYSKRVCDMHNLTKYLPPPLVKGESAEADNCTFLNQEFMSSEVLLAIKDRLPLSMQGDLEDHPEKYCSFTYEYWCDLLSTIEVKYERKRAVAHIKNIASAIEASLYDRDKSVMIPRKKKASNSFLCPQKKQKKAQKYHGIQHYHILCKKAGISELKYILHSAEYCTGVRNNQTIKDVMGGSAGNRADSVNQYKKSEKNGRKG